MHCTLHSARTLHSDDYSMCEGDHTSGKWRFYYVVAGLRIDNANDEEIESVLFCKSSNFVLRTFL